MTRINTTDPTLLDVLDQHKKNIFLSLNCHALGTILKFDAKTQTCEVKFSYKKKYIRRDTDSSYTPKLVEYPILIDCPLISLFGGAAGMTMPIAVDDPCLILFNDRDIDNWMVEEGDGEVASNRKHSTSDAMVLVGVRPIPQAKKDYSDENLELYNDESKIILERDKITMKNDKTIFYIDDFTAYMETGDSSIRMQGFGIDVTNGYCSMKMSNNKLDIKNFDMSLADLIKQLISDINNITATSAGSPVVFNFSSLQNTYDQTGELFE